MYVVNTVACLKKFSTICFTYKEVKRSFEYLKNSLKAEPILRQACTEILREEFRSKNQRFCLWSLVFPNDAKRGVR